MHAHDDKPLDPLQRVFVPREGRNVDGVWTFKTSDGEAYYRASDGSIRRKNMKVDGKAVRKARRRT